MADDSKGGRGNDFPSRKQKDFSSDSDISTISTRSKKLENLIVIKQPERISRQGKLKHSRVDIDTCDVAKIKDRTVSEFEINFSGPDTLSGMRLPTDIANNNSGRLKKEERFPRINPMNQFSTTMVGLESDITVVINSERVFHLHKFPLYSKVSI